MKEHTLMAELSKEVNGEETYFSQLMEFPDAVRYARMLEQLGNEGIRVNPVHV